MENKQFGSFYQNFIVLKLVEGALEEKDNIWTDKTISEEDKYWSDGDESKFFSYSL